MKKFFQLFNFFGAKTIDGGKGNKMLYLKVSTVENFNKYLEEIKNAGFEKISNREINGNIFCTLTSKKEYVYAYYLKYNGSIKDICDNLFIHRNTIIYRIQKIEELTKCNLHSFVDSFRLYSLHTIYQILTKEEIDALA